jgi:hypothetical protein
VSNGVIPRSLPHSDLQVVAGIARRMHQLRIVLVSKKNLYYYEGVSSLFYK